jgi:TonB family protein
VRVVVDDRGIVLSAIVQSSSGMPAADQFALQTANQLRFSPLAGPEQDQGLGFGEIVFNWNTSLKETSTEPPAQ